MPNRLLLKNKAWANDMSRSDKAYFRNLAKGQQPRFFWIGCSDSRVPVSQITQTEPNEIFTHRNIANLVPHGDISVISSLQYAVEVLKVPYVVVCGHYGCGGIKAALSQESFGQLDEWLLNIRNIYKNHQNQLDAITDEKEKADKLVELNVKTQVKHIATTLVYQHTWNKADGPTILGWVFNLETGLLEQLTEINEPSEAESLV